MQSLRQRLFLSAAACCFPLWAAAQQPPPSAPDLPPMAPEWIEVFARDQPRLTESQEEIAREIVEFRAELARAVRERDVDRLKKYYARNFTMTHGSGYVDDWAGRIGWALRARQTTENRPLSLRSIRVYGQNTAVTVETSPYSIPTGNGQLRVMTIYRRVDEPGYRGWQQAAFQVNNLANATVPEVPTVASAPGSEPIPPQR